MLLRKNHPLNGSDSSQRNRQVLSRLKRFNSAFVLSFVVFFGLWVVFSGRFDGFHIFMGIVANALVAIVSGDLLFTSSKGCKPILWHNSAT